MSSSKDDSSVDVSVPKRVITARFIYTLLTIYLALLWLHNASESFSAARKMLTPERNALGLKILEAYEYLRW
jgi:hypothetical protein